MSESIKIKIGQLFNVEKGSLQSSKCVSGDYDFITASSEWKTHKEYSHHTEALIVAVAASGSLGRVHYVNGRFISSDLCFILTPKDAMTYPVDLGFYLHVFKAIRQDLVQRTATGTSKLAINKGNFENYEVPYFDIVHQSKYREKLIKFETEKDSFLEKGLTQNSLLKRLRQQILQDAISGKLTADWRVANPNVEPASKLLEQIKAEKEKLIIEKKIKKEKPLERIAEDEVPFGLPEGWEWSRLGEIISVVGGKRLPAGHSLIKEETPFVYIRVSDMKNGTIDNSDLHYLKEETFDLLKAYRIYSMDIYMTIVGATIGKCGIIPSQLDGMVLTENAIRVSPIIISNLFLEMCFNSPFMQNQFIEKTKKVGVEKMAIIRFKNSLIPIPPINEQRAIVAKVERLMGYVSQLEKKIANNANNAQVLMQAFLGEAFQT